MSVSMPDIANTTQAQTEGMLDWVGMSHIKLPLMISSDDAAPRQVTASVEAFVNLKVPQAKGIHMSRLYLQLDQMSNEDELNLNSMTELLQAYLDSHEELSDQAFVKFGFDYHIRRKSLISEKLGWKAYPVVISGWLKNGKLDIELELKVPYSSTCPCSAALARQLIQKSFAEQYKGENALNKDDVLNWLGTTQGIVATPHSQRSIAQVKVKLDNQTTQFPIVFLIDLIEDALQTPVQAAVKRADEQEFARLNGQNLMFCEDAARRLQHVLLPKTEFRDFWLRVNHYESLHAHDAVAVTTKGVENGYQP